MFNRLTAWLFAPALLQAQLPFFQNSQPASNQILTMHAKPSLVRVIAGCTGTYLDRRRSPFKRIPFAYNNKELSVGSGYFISPEGYIVTNAHIVHYAAGSEQKCKEILQRNLKEKLGVTPEEVESLLQNREIELLGDTFHSYQDVMLPNANKDAQAEMFRFEVKEKGTFTNEGSKDVAIIKIAVRDAPVLRLSDDYDLQIQDPIIVIGYPGAADSSFLSEGSIVEATITEGIISNPNKTLKDGSPIIQVDVRVANGSSGSSVLNDQGEVIGMITLKGTDEEGGFIPFAIPTSTIQEFVRKSGAENRESSTDLLYREGLTLLWRGDYEGARKKFRAVTSLFQQHSEANRLIRESDQRIAEEFGEKGYLRWLMVIGIAVAVLGVAYWIAKRRSLTPALADTPTNFPVEPVGGLDEPEQTPKREAIPRFINNIFRPPTMVSTQAFLELQNQQGQVRRLYLQQERHQLGRDLEWSDIEIPDQDWEVISRRQAVIEKVGEGYCIYDGDHKSTTNGIFINGNRIDADEGYLLQDQDRLEIGQDAHNLVILTYFNPISSRAVTTHSQVE